ncbi:MAG: Arm DNA-binding domain-containing protein, partial [Desulfovibrio sp.]
MGQGACSPTRQGVAGYIQPERYVMLTDTQIRNLKPAEKAKKYADGGGLYLYVAKTGSKLWRMAYRFNNKEKLLSFGEYPIVSLKDARTKRNEAKKLIADGIEPSSHKKE